MDAGEISPACDRRGLSQPDADAGSVCAVSLQQSCGRQIGGEGVVFRAAWPVADEELAREDEIEIPVQVNGKLVNVVKVPAGSDEATVKAAALADEKVQGADRGQDGGEGDRGAGQACESCGEVVEPFRKTGTAGWRGDCGWDGAGDAVVCAYAVGVLAAAFADGAGGVCGGGRLGFRRCWCCCMRRSGFCAETPVDYAALRSMTVLDPMGAAATLAKAMAALLPPVLRVALWLVPVLLVVWVVVSSVGRTVVLRRVDPRLHARVGTLMVLQAMRMVALAGSFAVWFWCMQWAAEMTVTGPIAQGGEPNLVGYFALVIVATLGLFTLWAVVSWVLSVAPLLAMLEGLGVGASLAAAFRLGPLKAKLVEINLVMGIVKIALIVLAMVFSATPLPFESVTTPEFLMWWWVGVTVLYFLASDFFHVARLVAYLELWRAYEQDENLLHAGHKFSHLRERPVVTRFRDDSL